MRIYAFDLLPWPYLEAPSLYPDPNSLFDPVKGHTIYEQHLRQIEYLEECGFDAICFNEQHSAPYGLMPSPNVMASAVAQRTSQIEVLLEVQKE